MGVAIQTFGRDDLSDLVPPLYQDMAEIATLVEGLGV